MNVKASIKTVDKTVMWLMAVFEFKHVQRS